MTTIEKLRNAIKTILIASDDSAYARGVQEIDSSDIDGADEDLESMVEHDEVGIDLPGDDDEFTFTVSEVIRTAQEIAAGRCGDAISVRTPKRAFQIIEPRSEAAIKAFQKQHSLGMEAPGLSFFIDYRPFIVGVFAAAKGSYHRDYAGAASYHPCVHVQFADSERSDEELSQLVDAYLFDLAAYHEIVFSRNGFVEFADDWQDEDEESSDKPGEPELPPCAEPFNAGMALFLTAIRIGDSRLEYFSLYKVLEHFAPVVVNLEAQELLRKKLESKEAFQPSAQFIADVYEIARRNHPDRKDDEMIRGVLSSCIDIVGLNRTLPAFAKGEIDYSSKKDVLDAHIRKLAEQIFATRNEIVHAKSNYRTTGKECPAEELGQFIEFMRLAAIETIRWFNRLPAHQRHAG